MHWLRDPDAEPIPGYRLVEPLGSGGFGEVWKCVAPGGIPKAIKFVSGGPGTLDGDDPRAAQELKALARVKEVRHPFVLSTEQVREVGGELVIVMELADRSLHDCLVEHQQAGRPGIPRDRLLAYLADAAAGLDHLNDAHRLQHLDVKPRNLFVVGDRVKVADFGLVRHLDRASGALTGGVSPAYAAPETFAGRVGRHADQYSLAVVYVELLTGRRPFAGKNIRQLALQHMTEDPDLGLLPPGDRPAVARALAKDPDARHPSCAAFVQALQNCGVRNSECGIEAKDGIGPRPSSLPAIPHSEFRTPHSADEDRLAATVPVRSGGGVGPAVLVGVGSFGRRALQEVRSRLADRLGDPARVPVVRFLYVDPDPDAAAKAAAARPDAALAPDEVVAVPLRPPAEYRRRPGGPPDWLPPEKLYAIPRNLRAGGNRALGRLAFWDHAPRFAARLSREVRAAAHPESAARAAAHAGLPAGGGPPRVYVFAAGAGGSGGMLADLGRVTRRVLARLHAPAAPVVLFLAAGAPDDPRTADWERANLYATLAELNHAADPEARLPDPPPDPDGSTPGGPAPPFTGMYLLPQPERTAGAFRDGLARLAAYLAHDLLTPLGPALDALRALPPAPGRTPFRGFGAFGVWFPRGLLLRAAAHALCGRLVREWAAAGEPHDPSEADALAGRARKDPRFAPDEVRQLIDRDTPRGPEGGAANQVERWLRGLEGQLDNPSRSHDPGAWAAAAWDQARELVGLRPAGPADSSVGRGRVGKPLDTGIAKAAERWGNEFAALAAPLADAPGRRLAAVEAGLVRLAGVCDLFAAKADDAVRAFAPRCRQARADVQAAVDACRAGSGAFSFLGGRSAGRAARHCLDQLREFARLRLEEDRLDATAKFYRAVRAKVEDRLRDLAGCRTRLRLLLGDDADGSADPGADTLADEVVEPTPPPVGPVRVVLPGGDRRPDRAVLRLLMSVRPADVARLDRVLQKLVLGPGGGLVQVCSGGSDLAHTLLGPLADQTTAFLADLLPAADVAEVELAAGADVPGRMADDHRRAAPAGGPAADERVLVAVPDTDAGRRYGELFRRAVPGAEVVPVPGSATDLLVCREQGYWPADDLREFLAACRPAYEAAVPDPATNPHSRFDVPEWLPLAE
jgi:hypothetical protein